MNSHGFYYSYITNYLGDYAEIICNQISGFLIVYAILFNEALSWLFSNKIGTFMGKVSFSVYLIHKPILFLVGAYLYSLVFQLSGQHFYSTTITFIATLILVYACSIIFYKLVDLQGMKLSNAFAGFVISLILLFWTNDITAKQES